MKKLTCLLLAVLLSLTLVACGSSSGGEDDSYKHKTWDQLNGEEKQKVRSDIEKKVEDSIAAGADWSRS